jgi:serine/threonine kinase 16
MFELFRDKLAACSSSLKESGLYRRCFPLSSDVEMGGRRLQLLRLLGEGGYSFVYLVRDLNDPEHPHYALKRIWAVTTEQLEAAKREIATISKLKHKNLLNALDSLLLEKMDDSCGTRPTEYAHRRFGI